MYTNGGSLCASEHVLRSGHSTVAELLAELRTGCVPVVLGGAVDDCSKAGPSCLFRLAYLDTGVEVFQGCVKNAARLNLTQNAAPVT